MKVYRGTQRREIEGIFKVPSYTTSLPVAVIYSAHPGDVWGSVDPKFLAASTVHEGELKQDAEILHLCDGVYCSFARVLQLLEYGTKVGITHDEARKILNYMHNRIVGKAAGGEFQHVHYDEDGDRMTDADLPFSLRSPYTTIRVFRDDEFDFLYEREEVMEASERLLADAFVFADAPVFRVVAVRLGYDVAMYDDVFAAGEDASKKLLGCDVLDLEGVDEEEDLEEEWVPTHQTIRPMHAGAIEIQASVPTAELLPQVRCEPETVGRLKSRLLR